MDQISLSIATTVVVDNGSEFVVGDLLEFGDASNNFNAAPSGEFYEITAIDTNLTLKRHNSTGSQDQNTQ